MRHFLLVFALLSYSLSWTQYSQEDSLRGGYGEGRDWWDITKYELDVNFNLENKSIVGKNTIKFKFEPGKFGHLRKYNISLMQIDLQAPMVLDSIQVPNFGTFTAENMKIIGAAHIWRIPKQWILPEGGNYSITVFFHGSPREAVNAPWDGGIIYKKDQNNNPWVTIACQGLGASSWFPCKDSQIDKPEGITASYTIPNNLVCVSNGKLIDKTSFTNQTTTYTWEVKNPINNYNIIPYIGDYVQLSDLYIGEKGRLTTEFWVIRGNEDKARKQFKDVPKTLEALEHWFGPYPFYEDGYKLIEAPHLGMEHQSAIAYGNGFQNGYNGKDLSETGKGLKWDFIIVHESGHEWFGNSITVRDVADMWIHEAFTSYSEVLFTEYWFGKADAQAYLIGIRKRILNDRPIIGDYLVQKEGSRDMYFKGSNVIHTLRRIINNDSLFRALLRQINTTFYHKTVSSTQLEEFISSFIGIDFSGFFDQYLRTVNQPDLELVYAKNNLKFKWKNTAENFKMPIFLSNYGWVTPTNEWQKINYKTRLPLVDPNFYIQKSITMSKDFKSFRESYFRRNSTND